VEKKSKKAFVVCGPTASGKSELADKLADLLSEARGARVPTWIPTLVVDSMQVYREIPTITNQARGRPAELVGVASVAQEWTVAEHRDRALALISARGTDAFVLDAGTGMYLNAILLEIPLAPRVPRGLRELAQASTADATNPRRAARAKELELAGAPGRGSVWEGKLRFDVAGVYLRPPTDVLDERIRARSERIVNEGLQDAERLRDLAEAGARINPSVLDSIGVRETLALLRGEIGANEASERISARTRRLARRQRRWFDKLARRTLRGRANLTVVERPDDYITPHTMHDIIGS
jgi:tRNA dimethylallyltransferase